MFRAAQRFQQQFALTFVKAEQWVNIRAAVAILGEEAGHRFRRMVGADYYALRHTGDAVLRLHALARFFIAAHKVGKLNARFPQRAFAGQHRLFDIYRQRAIRLDKRQRVLAILLIRLHAVGQAHSDKGVGLVAGLFAQFADRHLRQFARQRGVLTAADAQHQGLQRRVALQIAFEEINAAANFLLRVDNRVNAECCNDFLLQ